MGNILRNYNANKKSYFVMIEHDLPRYGSPLYKSQNGQFDEINNFCLSQTADDVHNYFIKKN